MKNLFRLSKIQKYCFIIISICYVLFFLLGFIFELYQHPVEIKFNKLDFYFVFMHNIYHMVKIEILGILTVCIYPFIKLILNALFTGMGVGLFFLTNNVNAIFTSFIPHAIFEILALLISSSIPMIFYWVLIQTLKSHKNGKLILFLKNIKQELIVPCITVPILTLLAAILECYVSKF